MQKCVGYSPLNSEGSLGVDVVDDDVSSSPIAMINSTAAAAAPPASPGESVPPSSARGNPVAAAALLATCCSQVTLIVPFGNASAPNTRPVPQASLTRASDNAVPMPCADTSIGIPAASRPAIRRLEILTMVPQSNPVTIWLTIARSAPMSKRTW